FVDRRTTSQRRIAGPILMNHPFDAERSDAEQHPMPQSFDADVRVDAPEADVLDLDSGFEVSDENLGIDVATAPELEDAELGAVLEALLLVVDTPVTVEALAAATEQPAYRVAAKLRLMADELSERDSGIDLREAGGGWRMYTRARFAPYVERLLLDGSRSKLTRAALETLAVVAYRQPVTRA